LAILEAYVRPWPILSFKWGLTDEVWCIMAQTVEDREKGRTLPWRLNCGPVTMTSRWQQRSIERGRVIYAHAISHPSWEVGMMFVVHSLRGSWWWEMVSCSPCRGLDDAKGKIGNGLICGFGECSIAWSTMGSLSTRCMWRPNATDKYTLGYVN
jgi:hypothetical protein